MTRMLIARCSLYGSSQCFDAWPKIYVGRCPQRIHAVLTGAIVQVTKRTRDRGMSIRQSAGSEERTLGSGVDRSQDEGVPVARAGASGPGGICRVDAR